MGLFCVILPYSFIFGDCIWLCVLFVLTAWQSSPVWCYFLWSVIECYQCNLWRYIKLVNLDLNLSLLSLVEKLLSEIEIDIRFKLRLRTRQPTLLYVPASRTATQSRKSECAAYQSTYGKSIDFLDQSSVCDNDLCFFLQASGQLTC